MAVRLALLSSLSEQVGINISQLVYVILCLHGKHFCFISIRVILTRYVRHLEESYLKRRKESIFDTSPKSVFAFEFCKYAQRVNKRPN